MGKGLSYTVSSMVFLVLSLAYVAFLNLTCVSFAQAPITWIFLVLALFSISFFGMPIIFLTWIFSYLLKPEVFGVLTVAYLVLVFTAEYFYLRYVVKFLVHFRFRDEFSKMRDIFFLVIVFIVGLVLLLFFIKIWSCTAIAL